MSEKTIAISAEVVPCLDGAPRHLIDPATKICQICKRHAIDLACPTCSKVYSHNVEYDQCGNMRRKWICRVCLAEGTDPFPEAREYQLLKGRKLGMEASGGPVEDSPQPDLRVEYPTTHIPKRKARFEA